MTMALLLRQVRQFWSHRTTSNALAKTDFYRHYHRHVSVLSRRGFSCNQSTRYPNIIKNRVGVDIDFVEDKSLPAFFFDKFDTFGNKPAIIDGVTGQQYSYSQLHELSIKLGSALTKLGFKKGDVCAIFCNNVIEYPIICFSVISLGVIPTLISHMATVPELCYQLNETKAQHMFTVPALASTAKEAAKQCGLTQVFVVGEAEGCRPISELFEDDGKSFPTDVEINPQEDVAALPFSSGTTGLPKGVMLTHFNITANIQQYADIPGYLDTNLDDKVLSVLPFFHIYGFSVILGTSFYRGATVVSLPKFEPELFLETIQSAKISRLFAVPPMFLFLAKNPIVDDYDITSVNSILSGAAPLSKDLENIFSDRHKIPINQGYGLTETSPVSHTSRLRFDPPRPAGSVGEVLPSTEVKVIDLITGKALEANKEGEICIRGPQVMKGYYNNSKATSETVDSDGWLHSGDIGYYDSNQFFYIVDRCKELIKYKGYQVAPGELEAVLLSHPKIQDAAIIGVPDEECGELPKGFIVANNISEDEVHSYVAEKLASYKKLRGGIEYVDEIPKSPSGKILRRVLKEQELSK